jgi:hypothetical protein
MFKVCSPPTADIFRTTFDQYVQINQNILTFPNIFVYLPKIWIMKRKITKQLIEWKTVNFH